MSEAGADVQAMKRAVGLAAAQLVHQGMLVGLGTGSTAACFIDSLISRVRQGLKITAVATSEKSAQRALQGGIHVIDINTVTTIDLTVDGADEIDPEKRMIKGGGGALLREKIIATSSSEMVVIVDETKCVKRLGNAKLPVEIVSFGYNTTIHRIEQLGYQGGLRPANDGRPYVTDNGNYIYDIHCEQLLTSPETDHQRLIALAGVVETGLFFQVAGRLIVGRTNGQVDVIP